MNLLDLARQVGIGMAMSVKSRLASDLELAWQHWDTLPYHALGTFAPFMGERLENGKACGRKCFELYDSSKNFDGVSAEVLSKETAASLELYDWSHNPKSCLTSYVRAFVTMAEYSFCPMVEHQEGEHRIVQLNLAPCTHMKPATLAASVRWPETNNLLLDANFVGFFCQRWRANNLWAHILGHAFRAP